MPNRDSLLQLFVKWGMHEDFPRLAERLAVEDIIIPNLRRTIQLVEILDEERKRKKIPVVTKEGEEVKANELVVQKVAEKTKFKDLLADPRKILREVRQKIINQFPVPTDAIRSNYEGLTDIEASFAFSQLALSAKMAG